MFVEIEETVCFLASFLYGNIPKSRIDSFSELLANGLAHRIYSKGHAPESTSVVVNVNGDTDVLLQMSAEDAFISVSELCRLLPCSLVVELRAGTVTAVNADTGHVKSVYPMAGQPPESCGRGRRVRLGERRRPLFHIDMAFPKGSEKDETAVARPNFEVERSDQVYTAQAFAATRFGSTKLKTFQMGMNGEPGYGQHPFTMPSVYAYLRLLVFLNAISCVAMIPSDEPQPGEEEEQDTAQAKEDAHIAAAIQYTVEWLNQRGTYGEMEYLIEYLDGLNHYEALRKTCHMVEKEGVIAIIGGSNALLNAQIQRLTDQLEVPFLTATDDLGEWTGRSKIDFFPRAQLFEAVVDLFRYWKWNRIIIVYEEDARIRRIEPLLENDQYASIRFKLVKVQKGNYMRAAKEVKNLEECRYQTKRDCSEFSRVLLDLNPEHTYNFLLAALQMGLIDLKYWFLLTSMELSFMDMELFRYNHARYISPYPVDSNFLVENKNAFNFTQFQQHIRTKWNGKTENNKNLKMIESILTYDALFSFANIFSDASAYQQMNDAPQTQCKKPTRPIRKYQHGGTLIDGLQKNNLRGLTGDLRRINPDPKASNFSFRIHLLGYSGNLDDIGFWEPATDITVNMTGDSKAQLQRNVQVSDELKPHFRVTTIMERPYVMLKKNHYELQGNAKFEGFCVDLMAELSRDLGFTYTIHVVRDGKYGNDQHGNGSWDGMIGEILRNEAEMAFAPLTANFRRSEVVDFTKPFLSLGISILYKVPDDQRPDLFSFLNPLSWQIWMAILTAIVGVTLGMFFVARLTPYEWNLNFSCCTAHQPHPAASVGPPEAPVELSNNYSFWNTLWYVTSTMLKGGCDFGPRAVSTRLLGGTWWVFTLVIISAYTANLAAVLTVSRPYIPIKNLDDLANQSKISFGTITGGSTMQFFQESRISSHMKMWEYMKNKDVFVKNNRAGVERALSMDYAYLMESTSLEYEVQQNCNLTQIGGVLGSKGYGIALAKKSEWTDRMSRQILLYAKKGVIEMKKTKWWRSKGATCTGAGSSVKQQRFSLSMYNVAGLFIILATGLLFGAVTVVAELFIRSRQVARSENKPLLPEIINELRFALNLNPIEDHPSRKKSEFRHDLSNGQSVPLMNVSDSSGSMK